MNEERGAPGVTNHGKRGAFKLRGQGSLVRTYAISDVLNLYDVRPGEGGGGIKKIEKELKKQGEATRGPWDKFICTRGSSGKEDCAEKERKRARKSTIPGGRRPRV